MKAWGALVVVVAAICLANALPTAHQLDFPENVRGGGSTRIVSGWEASQGQIPYQLSIRMVTPLGTVVSCGATIIHSEWALTAAHCTAGRVSIIIRAGGVALSHPLLIFETTDFYNHPLFDESLTRVQPNDIGLIKFNRVLEFNELVQPIRLQPSANKDTNYANIRLRASGWGRTWTLGSSPEVLNWVFLVGTSNEICRAAFGGSPTIVASTICAGNYNVTSQSTCQGDSGGPLTAWDYDQRLTQVGVTSFVSSSGCHTGFPAGFIRPGHYHEWFTQVTGINFDWEPSSESSEESSESDENSKTNVDSNPYADLLY